MLPSLYYLSVSNELLPQPQSLVRTLLNSTPVTTTMYSRRIALESMLRAIEDHIYEEVVPARIVNKRNSNGYDEYLVEWLDGKT